ncbi:choice-of-anchor D domain-containing protein [Hymenobacter sp. ASUV-10]|uniref:Choice-of-anchor D domain-containing protein n=1 Tax=Hymenobacter aranciens TaxID=3063996 RepID=A0ABT9BC40_9BACT|nr:choice-of-anchor D domain-containing protein [Hymenobacter sp. ASUV-10]MDO7875835.1 choice-of-anchor D domain-containing protein [Hymenobacter sp. ASUV-10]
MMKPLLSVRERLSAAALVAAMGCASVAQAQTIDGTRDASYPAALAVQTVNTSFGNNTNGNVASAGGSELDNIHAYISGSDLVIFIGGNLETNYNKLDLFFDSKGGGQNQLTGNTNFLGAMNGLTFDAGFTADYALSVTAGMATATTASVFANYGILPTGGGSNNADYINTGGTAAGLVQPLDFAAGGSSGSGTVALNNSNTAGVDGNSGTAATGNPGAVSTGIEYRIPLSALGTSVNGGDIKIIAFINNDGRNYLSNQVLAGLPVGTGNLANVGSVNFNNQAGNQYVTVTNSVAAVPNIGVSPGTAAFNNVGVGNTATRTVAVTNTGTAVLNVTGISSNNARFTAAPSGAFTVAVGATVNVTVTFAPTAAGAQTGTLSIASNDPGDPTLSVSLSGTGIAAGQVVLDGTADASLYTQKAVQTAPTQFGDNQSELDAAYVRVTSTDLYLTIAGNLESGGNKLLLFFDADPNAGQSTIAGNNSTAGASGNLAGLQFDRGFAPESFITVNHNGTSLFADYVRLDNGTTPSRYLSTTTTDFTQPLNFDGGLTGEASFNNSNTAGVSNSDASGAGAVTTGLELRIPLSALGAGITGTTPLHVMAVVANGDYTYFSNQTLGGLPLGTGNLGANGSGGGSLPLTIDFLNYPGNQFFTAQRGDVTIADTRALAGEYRNITINPTGSATVQSPLDVSGTLLATGELQFPNPTAQNPTVYDGYVTGSGTAYIAGTVVISSPDGITASGNTGNVRTAIRNYGSGGTTYHYISTAPASVTGSGQPTVMKQMEVDGPAGTTLTLSRPLEILEALDLTNRNLVTNGQILTLSSTDTGTALVSLVGGGVGTVVGNVTVQRYINPSQNAGAGYRHYSAPVSNTTLADLAAPGFAPELSQAATYNSSPTPGLVTPFPNIFGYDESRVNTVTNDLSAFDKGWFAPTTAAMQVGHGYTVNIPATSTVDFVGTLNNGDLVRTLGRSGGTNGGWHLVGNPYPAPLDYSQVAPADRPNLDAGMYVFESTGQYAGNYRSYVNGVGANALLASSQGFFVRVSNGQSSGSLTFRNSQRVTNPATQTTFRRGAADLRPQLQLTLQGGSLTDDLYVYAQAGATPGVDTEFDAVKLPNTHGLNLAALSGTDALAINGLPALTTATVVPLHVGVPAAGSYTFEAAALRNFTGTVYLRDAVTGQQHDLRQQPRYTFATTATTLAGRFTLVFAPAGAPLATAAELSAAQISVFPNPARQRFTVQVPAAKTGTVTVALYNSLGQPVRTVRAAAAGEATSVALDASGLAAGVYTLRVQAGSASPVAKRVVLE